MLTLPAQYLHLNYPLQTQQTVFLLSHLYHCTPTLYNVYWPIYADSTQMLLFVIIFLFNVDKILITATYALPGNGSLL